MRMIGLVVSGLVVAAPVVHGNGGGYFRGGLKQTGSVAGFEPEETGRVRIVDELLRIEFGPESARVSVRYIMRNVSDAKARVRFGFPVEELHYDLAWNPQETEPGVDLRKPGYCRDYRIEAAGRPLETTFGAELTREGSFRGLEGWLVSRVEFERGEEKVVKIRFTSDYPGVETFVSDDGHRSARLFRYRLSTAACWAGTIGRGRIELNPLQPRRAISHQTNPEKANSCYEVGQVRE